MSDQLETVERVAGNKGVKSVTHREDAYLDRFKTTGVTPPIVVTAETIWDQTKGVATLLMLGNGPDNANPPYYPDGVGDCVPVSVQNGRFFQSLIAFDKATGVATYVPGFRRPHTQWVLAGRYFPYGVAMGERGTPPAPEAKPDEGSDPTTYADWVVAQDAEIEFSAAIDVSDAASNPTAALLRIKQAAVDFNGVAITVNLCDQNMQEFNEHKPFTVGEGSLAPNPEEGHGLWLDAFTGDSVQLATWAWADQLATPEWITQCITSCRVYGTKSQAEQAGYDFAAWEAVAKTYPQFVDEQIPSQADTEVTPVSHENAIEELFKRFETVVHDAIHDVDSSSAFEAAERRVKELEKGLHHAMGLALSREAETVILDVLKTIIKNYVRV